MSDASTDLSAGADRTVRGVLFDLDGTLTDSEGQVAAAIAATLRTFGHTVTADQAIAVLGPPLRPMLEALTGETLSDADEQAMRTEYLRHYHATLGQVRPLPGAVTLLDALAAAGVPLAVVTNKREDSAHDQVAAMGWAERFATVIGADTAAAAKPAPDPALEALRRLGLSAPEVAFVGDMEADMACARAAGIPLRIGLIMVRAADVLNAAGATAVCPDLHGVRRLLLPDGGASEAGPPAGAGGRAP